VQQQDGQEIMRLTNEDALGRSREYAIDILPVPIMAAGPLVSLLVNSAIGRYLEFKAVDKLYFFTDNKLQPVPCSKSEVFKSKVISKKQKGQLMNFMKSVMDQGEDVKEGEDAQQDKQTPDYSQITLQDYLAERGISGDLQRFISYAIALDPGVECSAAEALRTMKEHLESVGKYGPTAFLFNMYGVAEVPQAFARVCAIYGGTYVLRRGIKTITTDEHGHVAGLVCTAGQELKCRHLVATKKYLPSQYQPPPCTGDARGDAKEGLWRCVCVVSTPLMQGREKEEEILNSTSYESGLHSTCIGIVAPNSFGNERAIYVVQLSHSTKACPKGAYVLHFTTTGHSSDPLKQCVAHLVDLETDVCPTFTLDPTPAPAHTAAAASPTPAADTPPDHQADAAETSAEVSGHEAQADAEEHEKSTGPSAEAAAPLAVPEACAAQLQQGVACPAPQSDVAEGAGSSLEAPEAPEKPSVLYYAIFNAQHTAAQGSQASAPIPPNLLLVPEVDDTLCQHSAHEAAHSLFKQIVAEDTVYFERLPDPYEQAAEANMNVTDVESHLLGVEKLDVQGFLTTAEDPASAAEAEADATPAAGGDANPEAEGAASTAHEAEGDVTPAPKVEGA